ncbi:MAG: RNA 2',3'-cyclic phosphodiesterase [Desulfobacterales bacterium]
MAATLRAFIAIEVPEAVSDSAQKFQERLRQSGVRARWVRQGSFHLTLRFLGDVPEERVGAIAGAMEEAASVSPPLRLLTHGLGVFPPKGPPKVLWMGLEGDVERLAALGDALSDRLESGAGIAKERRPFHAHLTLARFRDRLNRTAVQKAMEACGSPEPVSFVVESISLFESRLNPEGARYIRLASAPLGG